MTFTCTAATVDNLFTPPRIEWRYEGIVVPDSGNPQMNSTTGQLIFSDIMNEDSGDYTCRAIISIQESGIDNHYSETSTVISTDSKPAITRTVFKKHVSTISMEFLCHGILWDSPKNIMISEMISLQGEFLYFSPLYVAAIMIKEVPCREVPLYCYYTYLKVLLMFLTLSQCRRRLRT